MTPTTDVPERLSILLVEDDRDQRELICEALSIYFRNSGGCAITQVAGGAECLSQQLGGFDVILQDYNLPDMSGLGLLEEILERADLPVILVTGVNDTGTAVEAIRCGAQDYVVKLGDYLFALPILIEKSIRQHRMRRENERLRREMEAMVSELQIKNVQLQESLEKIEQAAITDPLTELANRRRFGELLERYYDEAVRYGFDLTCCMCDLDNYKDINDSLGHMVGDDLLILAANVVRGSLRSSDIAGRYGGDEFVLLLPHTAIQRGMAVGDRIRSELVHESSRAAKIMRPVTMSMGIASLGADRPDSADALVAMADRALYAAKNQGKDRIVIYSRMSAEPVNV